MAKKAELKKLTLSDLIARKEQRESSKADYPQVQRVDPWMQCTAYKGCTPKGGATCHYDGGEAMGSCSGCSQGKCLELRPLQAGQNVLLAGDQTYFILGVIL